MVSVPVEAVRELQRSTDDASLPLAERLLRLRRFCNEFKPSGPVRDRSVEDRSLWTNIDTDHLLTISSDTAQLSNYLVERVVAAT